MSSLAATSNHALLFDSIALERGIASYLDDMNLLNDHPATANTSAALPSDQQFYDLAHQHVQWNRNIKDYNNIAANPADPRASSKFINSKLQSNKASVRSNKNDPGSISAKPIKAKQSLIKAQKVNQLNNTSSASLCNSYSEEEIRLALEELDKKLLQLNHKATRPPQNT
jgi:hypothetical protein